MKIRPFDVGLEAIQHWQEEDEVHLPQEKKIAPAFLPIHRALDQILRRPSLDERLTTLMRPERIDPDLLLPATLSHARRSARTRFSEAAKKHSGRKRDVFDAASGLLDDDIELDEAVAEALSALFRG